MVISNKELMKRLVIETIIAALFAVVVVVTKPMMFKKGMATGNFGIETLVERGKVDHLFIGSSMFRCGIQADDVKKDDIFVITYDGNQPYLMYNVIFYLIRKGVKIENLYCDMYAYAAVSEPTIFDERVFLDTDIPFQLDILSELKTCEQGNFSSYYDALVTSNMEVMATWPVSYRLINARYDRGASLPSTDKGQFEESLDASEVPPMREYLNERQVHYIKEIVRLSQEKGINLCFIETPKYKKMKEETIYPVVMEKYAALLEGTKIVMDENTFNKIPTHTEIITYSFDDSNAEYFSDLLHLSGFGRGHFSKGLHRLLGIS